MNCPKCESEMEKVSIHEIEIDRCNSCNGIWFDEYELADFKRIEGSESVDIGDSGLGKEHNKNDLINCPKCSTRMIRMVDAKQSHIWFEHCGSCFGYFFDAGEIRDLKEDTIFDLIKSWLTPERKPWALTNLLGISVSWKCNCRNRPPPQTRGQDGWRIESWRGVSQFSPFEGVINNREKPWKAH